jgi:hypothetical protein
VVALGVGFAAAGVTVTVTAGAGGLTVHPESTRVVAATATTKNGRSLRGLGMSRNYTTQ